MSATYRPRTAEELQRDLEYGRKLIRQNWDRKGPLAREVEAHRLDALLPTPTEAR